MFELYSNTVSINRLLAITFIILITLTAAAIITVIVFTIAQVFILHFNFLMRQVVGNSLPFKPIGGEISRILLLHPTMLQGVPFTDLSLVCISPDMADKVYPGYFLFKDREAGGKGCRVKLFEFGQNKTRSPLWNLLQ